MNDIFSKNIVVTGSNGFIGKNLIVYFNELGFNNIFKIDLNTSLDKINEYLLKADIIFNFAGVNRPKDEKEFDIGNVDFLQNIVNFLIENKKYVPIILSSSTQAVLVNAYGDSKKKAEDVLINYSNKTNAKIFIYRFPNVFGKWSKPNYNSAVATFCYNISRDLKVVINDKDAVIKLLYIDDLCEEMFNVVLNYFGSENDIKKFKLDLNNNTTVNEKYKKINIYYYEINKVYEITVFELVNKIKKFKEIRKNFFAPNVLCDSFDKKLYSTYISFIDEKNFSYPLITHKDDRGSFTEILKTVENGQFSVNIINKGVTKGNHFHFTKNEKFLVVKGMASIKFRKMEPNNESDIIEYIVDGNNLEIVDIPCGYTHNITNIGKDELIVFMWANEVFNENKMDTYRSDVE